MVNYLALLVCVVASIALGSLWYGPLFGKIWMKGMNIDTKKVAQMKKDKNGQKQMMGSYFGQMVASILTIYVLARFIELLGITTFSNVYKLAFWIWLGFVLPLQFNSVLWEGRSKQVFFINAAYNLVNLLAVSSILIWL